MKSRRWLRATNSNSNLFFEIFSARFQEAYKMLVNKRKRGAKPGAERMGTCEKKMGEKIKKI